MQRLVAGRREIRNFARGSLLALLEVDLYLIALYLDRASAYRFGRACWHSYRIVLPYLRALALEPPTLRDVFWHFKSALCSSGVTLISNGPPAVVGTTQRGCRRLCSFRRVPQGCAVTIADEVACGHWLRVTTKYRAVAASPELALAEITAANAAAAAAQNRAEPTPDVDPETFHALMSCRVGACRDEPGFAARRTFEHVRAHFETRRGIYLPWVTTLLEQAQLGHQDTYTMYPPLAPAPADVLRTLQEFSVRLALSLTWLLNRELTPILPPATHDDLLALQGSEFAKGLTANIIRAWYGARRYAAVPLLAPGVPACP